MKRVKAKECFSDSFSLERLLKIHEETFRELSVCEEEIEDNLLKLKIIIAEKVLNSCNLCGWECKVNRNKGEIGFCGVLKSRVASEFIHMWEEPWISPSHTIFFSGCNFKCVYCQNWDISQFPDTGVEISPEELASIIEKRVKEGAINVNFVGGEPTPNIPLILISAERSLISSIFNLWYLYPAPTNKFSTG